MTWGDVREWCSAHARWLSYAVGSAFFTAWTVLRFFTQKTIFDLIGQQVVAQQWLHGDFGGTGIGVTNYILKILVLYMPLHLLPGSPRAKLIGLTIAVNIATLVLLGLVIEALLREFGVKVGAALRLAVVWLSAIAGSVFWVQFTNSRNLEVVGGLFLLYLGLRYLRQPGRRRLIIIALFGSVVFFADNLQLYMTAVPLLAYGLTVSAKRKRVWWLATSLVAAFLGSKLLFLACSKLLSVDFLQAGSGTSLSLRFLTQGIAGTAKAFVHLYAGGADAGRFREVCDILLFAVAAVGVGYAMWHRLIPRRLLLLVGYILIIDSVVYIASGETQQADTQRYLMTAPALVLLFGSVRLARNRFRQSVIIIVCLLLAVNAVTLGKTLVRADSHRFSGDAHLASVQRFLGHSHSTLAYASMDTALPMAYLYGSDTKAPLPLSCSHDVLLKTDTFYSRSAYRGSEAVPHQQIAIILDGAAITNVPSSCDEAAIITQLGTPWATTHTDDGSTVLLYGAATQRSLQY